MVFQSTLSVRRATRISQNLREVGSISIHALRKESDIEAVESRETHDISIHALRKESDDSSSAYSPPPSISIHALRKESDD